MVDVALAEAPRTLTAAELHERGVRLEVVRAGLSAPRVDVTAPRAAAADLRVALAWRVDAMRAQLRRGGRMVAGVIPTPVARPDLELPRWAPVTWRGPVERYGRKVWETRTAQRPRSGLCPSCGEEHADRGSSGDCDLCIAARVKALRDEGHLPAPEVLPEVPVREDVEVWRRGLYQGAAPRVALAYAPPAPWVCDRCQRTVEGEYRPADGECSHCEVARFGFVDLSALGGGR